jgi:uncharacterized protein HemX
MRDRLTREFTNLANAYPDGTGAVKKLYRAIDQIDELRRDLEDLLFDEQKPFDQANLGVYYPPCEDRISDFA